jgi:EAL domain-containing protein (putative c-di-GMP-specific phosphodiesterase class I)
MNNIDVAFESLKRLNNKGFKITIDDFGTGYSSLSYLRKLPAQTIKIDRSFIHDMDVNDDDRSIVEAIISMGKSLGKDVVAEGSETTKHIEALKFLNCYKVQGYYFSKPLPIKTFKKYIETNNVENQTKIS